MSVKILKNKANVLRHLRVHAFQEAQKKTQLNNDSIPVAESSASFSENISENVEDHYRGLENSVGFECLDLRQEFRFSFMITHVRMHLNQRPYKCEGFIRRYLMKDHFKKRHEQDLMKDITEPHDEKKLQCDICGKTKKSFQKSLMQHHVRPAQGRQANVCLVRSVRRLTSDTALKKHSLNHTNPTSASIQGSFDHEDEHSQGSVYVHVPPCNKKFTVYDALLRHVNTFSKPTACKYCGTVFDDKHLAVAHQRSCLGIPIGSVQDGKKEIQHSEKYGGTARENSENYEGHLRKIEQLSATPNNEQDKS
ncbi:hypothetical protein Btru_076182 [Bulinus truncatus]|nr:hypothetical protein Btru_076182 [Bulinus truncatus]